MRWSSVETIINGSKLFCEIMIHRMTKKYLDQLNAKNGGRWDHYSSRK